MLISDLIDSERAKLSEKNLQWFDETRVFPPKEVALMSDGNPKETKAWLIFEYFPGDFLNGYAIHIADDLQSHYMGVSVPFILSYQGHLLSHYPSLEDAINGM